MTIQELYTEWVAMNQRERDAAVAGKVLGGEQIMDDDGFYWMVLNRSAEPSKQSWFLMPNQYRPVISGTRPPEVKRYTIPQSGAMWDVWLAVREWKKRIAWEHIMVVLICAEVTVPDFEKRDLSPMEHWFWNCENPADALCFAAWAAVRMEESKLTSESLPDMP